MEAKKKKTENYAVTEAALQGKGVECTSSPGLATGHSVWAVIPAASGMGGEGKEGRSA